MRGVVCDNHPSNVSAYKKLLTDANGDANRLFVMINQEPVYLFFDSVHLIKNVKNNLLAKEDSFSRPFPSMAFRTWCPGGEISWKLLHDVHDIEKSLSANLKEAPKPNSKVCFLIANNKQLHISNAFEESRQSDKKLKYFYGALRWSMLYIISSCMSFAKNSL